MRVRSCPGSVSASARQLLAIGAVLAFCYLYFFPRWADWNQNSRFDQVLALVDDRTLAIDRYVANTGDYAYFAGHYYSDKAPGMVFLGAPAYVLFRGLVPDTAIGRLRGAAATSSSLGSTLMENGTGLEESKVYFFVALIFTTALTVVIPSVALGIIFYLTVLFFGVGKGKAVVATLLYSLASSAFPYSNSFVGHQTSAFLLFSAFAVILQTRNGNLSCRWTLLAGFLLGFAAITEYPTVLIGGILALYSLISPGKWSGTLVRLTAGAIPPIAMLAVYNLAAFGTPLPTGYSYSTLWADVHHTGFFSLTYPKMDALWGITFGEYRGLFFLSPFLLFAIPGYEVLWRAENRRLEFWVLLLAPISFLLFNASSSMWQGGFAVGPRYLVPSLPFLALAAGIGMSSCWQKVPARPLIVLASAWSLFAVWAETIAGQSFPDYTANPLFSLSVPRLASGDIARNAGMALGLLGWASLVPLALVLAAFAAILLSDSGHPSRQRNVAVHRPVAN